VAVVTQEGIDVDVDPGVPFETVVIPEGERAKSLAVVEQLCRDLARLGLTRSDAVVAVGGGVVTDVAGFAAAVYHRGVPYVNVATTLLGQVDAAIGGKTGVNLAEGKNLVGAFWQPAAVLCDTDALMSLPAREWSSGRGEMAKYAFLGDGVLDGGRPGAKLLGLSLDEQVAMCVAIKAAVVAEDERESNRRMVLNYGHTLGHALEAAAFGPRPRWDLRHGEAVAIGLVFAAELARRLGRIDDERVQLHRRVVGGFDLPTALPAGVAASDLMGFMARDKKARHDLTFVLDGPNGVEPVRGVGEQDVLATLASMGCAT
jgi:5-deoxy-5-amino-3-dehydroquinate synthase